MNHCVTYLGLNTTWINYEIEKLVSTFYFIIILILLIIILSNPIHYNVYIKFVSFNLNSTNEYSNSTISNSNNVEDSEQTTSNTNLYSTIREPAFIIFIFSLIGVIVISYIHVLI